MARLPENSPSLAGHDGNPRRIAGVVVLYRPGEEVAANISSYIGQVDILFAIDNSEKEAERTAIRLRQLGNVIYIANGANLGVARALNMGARLALDEGCDFLLTMDQDSRANPGMVKSMLEVFDAVAPGRIGIVAPFLVTRPGEKTEEEADCQEVATAMTSGALLDLRAYQVAGPFLDELFVDFVDIEYCLRLRAGGFRIIRANRAVLEHRVGDIMRISLVAKDIYLTSHTPLRKYYKTRNRFFVAKKYRTVFPSFCRRDRIRFALELMRLLFFEGDKREKLAMMLRGYGDFRKGRMGRYDAGAGGRSP
ncbi:MAG TPA: glycosyltransferase family 2 protein [Geobacteraceae bacterium]|nr:glycosyltransferase family 2 protein [Geobacteraceae bacterium]